MEQVKNKIVLIVVLGMGLWITKSVCGELTTKKSRHIPNYSHLP